MIHMRTTAKLLAAAGVVVAMVMSAGPAYANSFSWNVGAGVVSYNDGTDQICADAYTGGGTRIVEVRLVPLSRPGPSYTWTDSNSSGAATCRSLATAYEDTQYRATVRTYWGETAEWSNRGSKTFYS
jgi:hypothetical protein